MRVFVLIIVFIMLSLSIGCNDEPTPTKVIDAFIESFDSEHPEKIANLLNKVSRPMATQNLVSGHGIAWIVDQISQGKQDYRLELEKLTEKQSTVILKSQCFGSETFLTLKFPDQLRKDGVRFYLSKESGKWKIDLIETEYELANIGLDYLSEHHYEGFPGATPPWMPTPAGMGGSLPRVPIIKP